MSMRRALVAVGGLLVVGALGGTGAVALVQEDGRATAASAVSSVAVPQVAASSLDADGRQPFDVALIVEASDGELVDVVALDPGGEPVAGRADDGVWRSSGVLVPSTSYRLTATVRDAAGAELKRPLVVRTADATHLLGAKLSPGDDVVVGVGQPVVLTLDAAVQNPDARAAVLERLSVTSTPSVEGGWRWMDDRRLHYRPAQFWPAGTTVSVRAELEGLALPGGVYGAVTRTSEFSIGDAVVSTVDVAAHTMTVTRNGEVLRVLPASMGRPEHPTRGGTHLVLEKDASRVMNSDTVGLPGQYRTQVEWAVRLTYSGTFTHSAPWSVKDQGVRNVSHGCINLSPADAQWFYELARRGDVVHVVGTDVAPLPDDPGSADWNVPFDEWTSGRTG